MSRPSLWHGLLADEFEQGEVEEARSLRPLRWLQGEHQWGTQQVDRGPQEVRLLKCQEREAWAGQAWLGGTRLRYHRWAPELGALQKRVLIQRPCHPCRPRRWGRWCDRRIRVGAERRACYHAKWRWRLHWDPWGRKPHHRHLQHGALRDTHHEEESDVASRSGRDQDQLFRSEHSRWRWRWGGQKRREDRQSDNRGQNRPRRVEEGDWTSLLGAR